MRSRFPLTQVSTKALDRISSVYLEEADSVDGGGVLKGDRRGGGAGRRRKAPLLPDSVGSNNESGELPSVSALARFAIERERLAREMGVDELGGPATLGVVNVVGTNGHSRRKGGTPKRAKPIRGRDDGISSAGTGGIREGGGFSSEDSLGRVGRSAGEILLEKLESVAEARSIQVMGCLLPRIFRFSDLVGAYSVLSRVWVQYTWHS